MSGSTIVIILLMLLSLNHSTAGTESHHQGSQQAPKPVYMQISYLSVPADRIPLFMIVARQHLLPAQMERINNGEILDWNLYEALVTGPDYQYNYVSITKTTNYGELFGERVESGENTDLSWFLPPGLEDVNYPLLSPKYSEIWVTQGAALKADAAIDSETYDCRFPSCLLIVPPLTRQSPGSNGFDAVAVSAYGMSGMLPSGNYITKNFMDTRGSSGEHLTLELDFWRQIHHVRIEREILNSWAMYTLSKPGGSSRKYTYSTIDYYDRLADIEGFEAIELAAIAHPEMSEQEISEWMNRTGPSRTAWKTELWRRVTGTFAN